MDYKQWAEEYERDAETLGKRILQYKERAKKEKVNRAEFNSKVKAMEIERTDLLDIAVMLRERAKI